MEYLSASTSAPSPREMVHSPGIFGLTIRQPRAEFHICSCEVGYGFDGFSTTQGARVMLSTPHAMVMSASPTATVRDAPKIASMPLPHNRLTVAAGIVVGSPASSNAMRPTLRLSSPAPLASPAYTSSIDAGSSEGERSTMARTAADSRSSGRTPASAPPILPSGVRTASTMNASLVVLLIVVTVTVALLRRHVRAGRAGLPR